MRITTGFLREHDALEGTIGVFELAWPDGIEPEELTVPDLLRASKLGVCLDEFARRVLLGIDEFAQEEYRHFADAAFFAHHNATAYTATNESRANASHARALIKLIGERGEGIRITLAALRQHNVHKHTILKFQLAWPCGLELAGLTVPYLLRGLEHGISINELAQCIISYLDDSTGIANEIADAALAAHNDAMEAANTMLDEAYAHALIYAIERSTPGHFRIIVKKIDCCTAKTQEGSCWQRWQQWIEELFQ